MAAASVAVLSALAGRLSRSLVSIWHAATARVARDNIPRIRDDGARFFFARRT